MVPRIAVPDPLCAGIAIRALMQHARQLLNAACDPEEQVVTRRKLAHTAGIALDLAKELIDYVPNMPTEFPDEFDAELVVWLKTLV